MHAQTLQHKSNMYHMNISYGMTLALLSSFTNAMGDPIKKKLLEYLDPLTLVAYRGSIVAPLFAIAAMIEARSVPAVIQPPFYRAVLFSGSINLISSFLYNKSLQLAPLSSSVPYLSFTPVFLVGTSFILLGETPSLLGFMGTICVTTGGYFLHRQDTSHLKMSEQKPKNKSVSHPGH